MKFKCTSARMPPKYRPVGPPIWSLGGIGQPAKKRFELCFNQFQKILGLCNWGGGCQRCDPFTNAHGICTWHACQVQILRFPSKDNSQKTVFSGIHLRISYTDWGADMGYSIYIFILNMGLNWGLIQFIHLIWPLSWAWFNLYTQFGHWFRPDSIYI